MDAPNEYLLASIVAVAGVTELKQLSLLCMNMLESIIESVRKECVYFFVEKLKTYIDDLKHEGEIKLSSHESEGASSFVNTEDDMVSVIPFFFMPAMAILPPYSEEEIISTIIDASMVLCPFSPVMIVYYEFYLFLIREIKPPTRHPSFLSKLNPLSTSQTPSSMIHELCRKYIQDDIINRNRDLFLHTPKMDKNAKLIEEAYTSLKADINVFLDKSSPSSASRYRVINLFWTALIDFTKASTFQGACMFDWDGKDRIEEEKRNIMSLCTPLASLFFVSEGKKFIAEKLDSKTKDDIEGIVKLLFNVIEVLTYSSPTHSPMISPKSGSLEIYDGNLERSIKESIFGDGNKEMDAHNREDNESEIRSNGNTDATEGGGLKPSDDLITRTSAKIDDKKSLKTTILSTQDWVKDNPFYFTGLAIGIPLSLDVLIHLYAFTLDKQARKKGIKRDS